MQNADEGGGMALAPRRQVLTMTENEIRRRLTFAPWRLGARVVWLFASWPLFAPWREWVGQDRRRQGCPLGAPTSA